MGCEFAFFAWLIIFIVLFFVVRAYHTNWWSTFVFALFFSTLILLFIYPMDDFQLDLLTSRRNKHDRDCSRRITSDRLLALIVLITLVVLIVYLFQRVFNDRCEQGGDMTHEKKEVESTVVSHSVKMSGANY